MKNSEISDLVENEQVPDVQDKNYGQRIMKYAKWPVITGGVLWLSLFGGPKKDIKNVDTEKFGQTQVSENNYAQEALDGIVNGLKSAGVNNAYAGGDPAQELMSKAKRKKESGNSEMAKVLYNKLTTEYESSPVSANAYNNLAVIYMNENKFDKAIEACKKSIHIGSDISAFYNLGQAYLHKAQSTRKEEYLVQAIEPYETYLAKGGTNPETIEYVKELLPKLKKFKKQ